MMGLMNFWSRTAEVLYIFFRTASTLRKTRPSGSPAAKAEGEQIHPKYEEAGARQQPLCASYAAGQRPQELAFGHTALEHQSLGSPADFLLL